MVRKFGVFFFSCSFVTVLRRRERRLAYEWRSNEWECVFQTKILSIYNLKILLCFQIAFFVEELLAISKLCFIVLSKCILFLFLREFLLD